jgi:L-ascorbate metabolism protein UlaG (beta-lactamase superfamily)
MTYNIISTGSKGNAVVINDHILVDCGVPFKALEPVKKDLRLVLLTHIHGDHFNPRTVQALAKERPSIRWGCCEWMVWPLLDAGVDKRRIDLIRPDKPGETSHAMIYNGLAIVRPEPLAHNVPNCGWHIEHGRERLFYATDTGTLDGVEAKGYDLYMVEANHTRAELEARMEAKRAAGEFSYEWAAAQNHLSREQAEDWLYQQMGPNSRYVFLHQHHEEGS